MKIISVKQLEIPEIKIIKFARFQDSRGYFTETFRKSDLKTHPELSKTFENEEFVQINSSLSKKNVARGLHFQWNPYMGKMVRTVYGRMIDIILDIRKNSPTYGKALLYEMPGSEDSQTEEWIWIPKGFAHGNYFSEKTMIEYLCTGEYSQGCEAGISMFAKDLDWSLAKPELKQELDRNRDEMIITEKDLNGLTLKEWSERKESDLFI